MTGRHPDPQAPAGWYPDPERPGTLRWWDGVAWTSHRHVPAEAPVAPEPAWRTAPPPASPTPSQVATPQQEGDLGSPMTIWWALLTLAVWFAAQLIAGVVAGAGVVLSGGDLEDPTTLTLLTVLTLVVSLGGVVGLLRLRLGSWDRVTGDGRSRRRLLWVAAGVGVVAPLTIGLGTDVLSRLLGIPLPEEPSQAVLADLSGASPLVIGLTFVLVVVLAPVVEELVFRRALFAALDQRMATWLAVAVSAIVFALVHVELLFAGAFGALQLGGLAMLGALFAIGYRLSGSAWPSIVAHATFNLVSLVAVLVVGS